MSINNHIKKAFIQFLLCVYVFALIKPITPAIKDFLAHTFWQSEHMSTVHYENGKYHLHVELTNEADAGDKNTKSEKASSSIDDYLASHLKSDELILEPYRTALSFIVLPRIKTPIDSCIQTVIPPPEACFG